MKWQNVVSVPDTSRTRPGHVLELVLLNNLRTCKNRTGATKEASEGKKKTTHTLPVAGGVAQILGNSGQSLQKTQNGAGDPSKSLEPEPNILIGEPVTLDKKRDVLIALYEPKATLFTDQMGRFPQQSSRGNNCQMILHDIDSNSTWAELTKNRTEGEMILARRWALARMKV